MVLEWDRIGSWTGPGLILDCHRAGTGLILATARPDRPTRPDPTSRPPDRARQAQWLERGRQAREKARLRRLDELAPVARELGRRAAQLPRIDGAAAPEALQRLCEDWPTPRASKFYKLRLWNVLGDMASPGKAGRDGVGDVGHSLGWLTLDRLGPSWIISEHLG